MGPDRAVAMPLTILAFLVATACGPSSTARQTWRPELLDEDVSGIPVASSPSGLARPDGILAIQRALIQRRLLPAGHLTGTVDEATQSGLRVLQRQAGLPITGFPGYVTLDALELDPQVVFHHGKNKFRLAGTKPPPAR